jgi:hypothetical protein
MNDRDYLLTHLILWAIRNVTSYKTNNLAVSTSLIHAKLKATQLID